MSSVTVTDQGSAIKTETGERSDTITASQIENLSIISRSSTAHLRTRDALRPSLVIAPSHSCTSDAFTLASGTRLNRGRILESSNDT